MTKEVTYPVENEVVEIPKGYDRPSPEDFPPYEELDDIIIDAVQYANTLLNKEKKKKYTKWTSGQLSELRSLAAKGLTADKIAEAMGMREGRVTGAMRLYKISFVRRRAGRTKDIVSDERLKRLVDEGKCVKEIVEETGISTFAVRKRLYHLGLVAAKQQVAMMKPHASHVYYELLADGICFTFCEASKRDEAYDYCRDHGLSVWKSAAGKADRTYDYLSAQNIYELIKATK